MEQNKLSKREIMAMLASGQFDALRSAGYSLLDAIGAGYSLRDARGAGYSLRDAIGAGYSLLDAIGAGYSLLDAIGAGYSLRDAPEVSAMLSEAPLVERPYSRMLAQIKAGERVHNQKTYGPDNDPGTNLCGTPMCTAGALVNMGGAAGYALRNKHGFPLAAALIHEKAHPGWPCQNFGIIPQEWAMAFIEESAEREEKEAALNPQESV